MTRTGVKPRCGVCRFEMHKTLAGEWICRRAACGRPAKTVKAKRAKPRRVSVMRDRDYLNWLRDQRCVVTKKCGYPIAVTMRPHLHWKTTIVDPAHGPPAGRGMKGPDNEAIPLTRYYHDEQTKLGWAAFEAKYGIDREKEAAAHWALYKLIGKEDICL